MGKFYGLKIRSGEMTLNDVQSWWRSAVEKWLAENSEV